MKQTKTKNPKYPLKITLKNGVKVTVPKQSKMSNAFLRKHGCSLMAEYVALQFLGVHKWPINILRWHKKYDKAHVKAKVTVKGVSVGINKQCKGKGSATYYKVPTKAKMAEALKAGHAVILEQKNPIHTIIIIPDGGVNYLVNYGKVSKANVGSLAKTATTNATYRGMVIVRRR